jgi:hypothetical protein
MYAKDHPDEFKVLDGRIVEGVHPHQVWKDWSGVFSGKLADEFDRNPILFMKKYYNINVLTKK